MWCITVNAKRERTKQRNKEREIWPSKNKLLVLVPQRGITSSIVSQLFVIWTNLQASHAVCHLLPNPAYIGLRYQCPRCHPPRKNKGPQQVCKKKNSRNRLRIPGQQIDSIYQFFLLSSTAVSVRLPPTHPSPPPSLPSPCRLSSWRPRLHAATSCFPPRPYAPSP